MQEESVIIWEFFEAGSVRNTDSDVNGLDEFGDIFLMVKNLAGKNRKRYWVAGQDFKRIRMMCDRENNSSGIFNRVSLPRVAAEAKLSIHAQKDHPKSYLLFESKCIESDGARE